MSISVSYYLPCTPEKLNCKICNIRGRTLEHVSDFQISLKVQSFTKKHVKKATKRESCHFLLQGKMEHNSPACENSNQQTPKV